MIPLASAVAGCLLVATGPADSIVVIAVLMLSTALLGTLSPAIRHAPARPADDKPLIRGAVRD